MSCNHLLVDHLIYLAKEVDALGGEMCKEKHEQNFLFKLEF